MWVIPVGLVSAILVVALGVMVFKYKRLQRSFTAFAHRGYRIAAGDDDDGGVHFHRGIRINHYYINLF